MIFTSGEWEGGDPVEMSSLGRVVLIVGPNNSGKSTALREIHDLLGPPQVKTPIVVDDIKIECGYTKDDLWNLLGSLYPLKHDKNVCVLGRFGLQDGGPGTTAEIRIGNLDKAWNHYMNTGKNESLKQEYLQHQRFHIRAIDRLEILKNKRLGNFRAFPRNFIDHMMREREIRDVVRSIMFSVFGFQFVIDQLGEYYSVRLGHTKISLDEEEHRSSQIISKMDENHPIDTFGDGIKAFLALVTLTLTVGHRFVFIDDPEVYLHPPIARRLGSELMKIVEGREAQLFVTSHSSEFLQGCLESTSDITIIRFTFNTESRKGTVKQVTAESLNNILHDRLLRSTGVFDALFHRAAVIVESEADKVFYDEINRRLVETGRGISDTLFISAQNWQTTGEIAAPLREVGIPTALIIDIDTMRAQLSEWKHILEACNLPKILNTKMTEARSLIRAEVPAGDEIKNREFKQHGLDFLTAPTKRKASRAINLLAEYGVFVVPVGELECWLSSLHIKEKKKSKWVRKAFTKMGATADADNYLQPKSNDVWKFVDNVATWLENPKRKGM